MEYKLLCSYSASPTLVYDGGEPQKIAYHVPGYRGKPVDLWRAEHWQILTKEGINAISKILSLPMRKLLAEEVPVILVSGRNVPVRFTRVQSTKHRRVIVCYALFEKQPSRYQCYVVGIIEEVEHESQ